MIIESIGTYLPSTILTTDEVLAGCARKFRFPLERLTGIRARHTTAEQEFSIDLARKAAVDCLARSRWSAAEIDLLVCCNISRCDGPRCTITFEPSTAVRLRHALGMRRALCFDVNNACAGMFTGLYVAQTFLSLNLVANALIVSGEYITHLTRTAQREIEGFLDPRLACLTLGDAGAAVLVEPAPSPRVGFRELELYTLGHYSDLCIGRATEREHGGAIMLTDVVRLAAVTVKEAVAHAVYVQTRGGWPPDGFNHLIPHQTSRTTMYDAARETNSAYGREVCPPDVVVSNLQERGNTATTTHVVALADGIRSGRIQSGEHVVFGITGSGVTIGTAIYTLDDLPERMLRNGHRPESRSGGGGGVEAVRPAGALRVRIAAIGLADRPSGKPESLTLGMTAARDALARWGKDPGAVGLLLHAGVYRSEFLCEPAVATLLAGRLQINDAVPADSVRKTLAFDVLNGAVGLLNACEIAVRFLQAGRCQTAMVVATEVENNIPTGSQLLLGVEETGSALILEPAVGEAGFGRFLFRAFADYRDSMVSETHHDGARTTLRWRRDPRYQEQLLECVEAAVADLLAAEGCSMSDVDALLVPQISPDFVARLADRLGVPRARVPEVSGAGGDWFTSSLPRALHQAGDRRPGELALVIAAGSGVQVGCATYRV